MKKLLKLMLQNYCPLRAEEGAEGADGGANKDADLAAQVAALQARLDKLTDAKKTPNDKPTADEQSLIEKAQEQARQAAQRAEERGRMQAAIKFNMGAQKFVDENKDYLTKLSPNILQTVAAKNFSDEELKARATQAALLEDFFSLQENLDAAPEEVRPRILAFKALASDEKEKQAAAYWDTLTLTVGQKKMAAKLAAVQRANSGQYEETNDLIKNYNAQVFALKSKYLGQKEQAK